MTTYTYNDSFIVDSIDLSTLEDEEAKAVEQVTQIGITASPYIEKLVTCTVYKSLSALQLEDSGFQEKYDIYSKEFDRYYNLSITQAPTNVSTIPLGRG